MKAEELVDLYANVLMDVNTVGEGWIKASRVDGVLRFDRVLQQDVYASEEETKELVFPNFRTPQEKYLDGQLEKAGAFEQGVDAYPILYKIALELLQSLDDSGEALTVAYMSGYEKGKEVGIKQERQKREELKGKL